MAQISFRIGDESKVRADKILEQHGYSLSSYLQGIVEYIAKNDRLPVVIEFRPVALNPEEVFQEAIFQFREVYVNWLSFCEKELQVGQMTPLDKLRPHIDSINAAYQFYRQNEAIIRQAPSQLQKITGYEPRDAVMFACCIEYFPPLVGFLRHAVGCINMNNRPIAQSDLDEMALQLAKAANIINELQSMANTTTSTDTLTVFMLRDIDEALNCASEATRPNISYITAQSWQMRMFQSIESVEKKYKRLGTTKHDVALANLRDDVNLLAAAVKEYVETRSEPMKGFDQDILDRVIANFREIVRQLDCVSATIQSDARRQ